MVPPPMLRQQNVVSTCVSIDWSNVMIDWLIVRIHCSMDNFETDSVQAQCHTAEHIVLHQMTRRLLQDLGEMKMVCVCVCGGGGEGGGGRYHTNTQYTS